MGSYNFISQANPSPTSSTPAATSVSFDATVWFGENQIRRVAANLAQVYIGDNTAAQDIVVPGGDTISPAQVTMAFGEATSVLVLVVSSPIEVSLTIGLETSSIFVNKMMLLDSGVSSITFINPGAAPIYVQLTSLTANGTDVPGGIGITNGYSGYSGIDGQSGYSGFSGVNGGSGYSGYSGRSGYSGFSGFSGASGYSGYSGYSGRSGYSGFSGTGISGYSGFSGATGGGSSGYSGYSGVAGASGYSGAGGGQSGYSGFSGAGGGQSGYSGYSGLQGISGYSGAGGGQSGYSGFSGATGAPGSGGGGSSYVTQNIQSASYTLVLSDANGQVYHPSTDTTARVFTIPDNSSVAYPIGTTLTFVNAIGAGTITISTLTDVMWFAGSGSTGSRVLAGSPGIATALKVTSTGWIISGTGLL